MKVLNFGEKCENNLVMCLGHFDGLHIGHRVILLRAMELAEKYDARLALFTFDDNFSTIIKGDKNIYNLDERLKIYKEFGVDTVVVAPSTKQFLAVDAKSFVQTILDTYNIKAFVSGTDYTFGVRGLGNADLLKEMLVGTNVEYLTVPKVQYNGSIVSCTLIKDCLEFGKMELVSQLLGYDYSIEGEVIHGVNIGEKMGFPTLNVVFPVEKKMLRRGVYKTYTEIDGVFYDSITNFGTQPTFDRYNFVTETHVLNFKQNVYGKVVKVYFKKFVRGLIKFNSMEDLIVQIKEDLKCYD